MTRSARLIHLVLACALPLPAAATDKMESETWLLKSGRWQIEAMANLDRVPAVGALIVVAWPKVENGFGFPARAFAILP